jgi:transposase
MKRSVENELLAAVRRLQRSVDHLAAENTELKAVIAEKDKRIAELEAELAKSKKNSSTSSKPPSSDIVKPSRPWKKRGKRKIGGQPGHPKQERRPFSPEEIDETHDHELLACPCCCGPVRLLDDDPKTAQQVDLPKEPVPIKVREDRAPVYWCDGCETKVTAPMPIEIERVVTQGTRSERGRKWCERIWTVMATCAQQGRSAFDFILESVEAYFHGRAGPSLLPQPSPG